MCPDDFTLFPNTIFTGGKDKTQARQMADSVLDMTSWSKRKRLNPDGSETMLSTKGGHPEVVTTKEESKEEEYELFLYCRLIDKTHPWGVAKAKTAAAANTTYTVPSTPVSKGKLPTSSFSCFADEDKTDSPGPNRWKDTRSGGNKQSSSILSWASADGSSLAIEEPYRTMYNPYLAQFGAGIPKVSVPQSDGTNYFVPAGELYQGNVLYDPSTYYGAAGRFTSPRFAATKLYIDGKATGVNITDRIVAAALCFSGGKHVRLLTRPDPVSSELGSSSIMLCYRTMTGGTIPSMPDKYPSYPSDVTAILSVNRGPAFNSSGTKAIVGMEVLLVGYSGTPADLAHRKHRVYEIDTTSGVATEYLVGGTHGTSYSDVGVSSGESAFPNHVTYLIPNAANFTKVLSGTTIVKKNTLLAVGYRGDDVRVVRLAETITTRIHSERTNTAVMVAGSSPHWEETSLQQLRDQSYVTAIDLVVEPIGTVFSTSGGPSLVQTAISDKTSYTETSTQGWIGAQAGVPQRVLVDFISDTYLIVNSKTYSLSQGYSSSTSVTAPQGSTNGSVARTYSASYAGDFVDINLMLATEATLSSPTNILSCNGAYDSSTYYSGGTETFNLPFLTVHLPTADGTPGTTSGSTSFNGLSGSRMESSILPVGGVTMGTTDSGSNVIVSAMLGKKYNLDVPTTYGMVAAYNLLCTKTSTGWKSSAFSLPDYVGDIGWMIEQTIVSVKK